MSGQFYDEEMSRKQEQMALTPDMKAQRELVVGLLNLKPGERVLDVGSGNGILVRELREIVGVTGHACGVDGSGAMVLMASRACPEAVFLQGDATNLPVAAEMFDAVTASQVLCFVPDPDKALSQMHRVLKPGGRLVILDTDWSSLVWNCRDQDLMDRAMALFKTPYVDPHVPRTLSRRLQAAGFEITARHTHTILNWELDDQSYSRQCAGFLEAMMKGSDDFTQADWDAWAADQQAVAAAGEYMFSLNRYVFCATKP